jgi:hypothetical protein
MDPDFDIPSSERPAYLEWSVWRAFLAINRIVNPPFDSRKFRIDRDFKPIGNAPGGNADLIFEFEDFILVVEVTLLTTYRQASAELVGVQRHVYTIAKNAPTDKQVFCLFLAPSITNMVGRDFKKAVYEDNDGNILNLTIIPVTLRTFIELFKNMFEEGKPDANSIKEKILLCKERADEEMTTTAWLEQIENIFLPK